MQTYELWQKPKREVLPAKRQRRQRGPEKLINTAAVKRYVLEVHTARTGKESLRITREYIDCLDAYIRQKIRKTERANMSKRTLKGDVFLLEGANGELARQRALRKENEQ